MDKDLKGTGVSRPRKSTKSSGKPPDTSAASGQIGGQTGEDFDPEALMESAQSVKPKDKSSLYEDLHSNFLFVIFSLNQNPNCKYAQI